MDLRKVIKSGDRVVIKTPQGQTRKGKAVMYNPQYNSWVLNMGGAHGTPGIASEKNIVTVNGNNFRHKKVQNQSKSSVRNLSVTSIPCGTRTT